MKIGQYLRELRENMDLLQKTVAKKVGISNKVLSNYENNRLLPDLETFKLLCAFYNTSADELLDLKQSRPEKYFELCEEEKKVLSYYNRLNEDNKDIAKGYLANLCKEQQNVLTEKGKKSII